MSKLVYNCGNNDVSFSIIVDGKQIKEYKLWTSMLQRCYSKTFQEKNPTYKIYVELSLLTFYKKFIAGYFVCTLSFFRHTLNFPQVKI